MDLFNVEARKIPKDSLERNYILKHRCDSAANMFIPVVELFHGEVFQTEERKIYEYGFYIPQKYTGGYARRNDYTRTVDTMKWESRYIDVTIDNIQFSSRMGFLGSYEDNQFKILVCLAIKSNYIYSINKIDLIKPNFVLLINTSFIWEEKYKKMYRKVNTEYIKPITEMGVAIMTTNNIESWCYNPAPQKTIRFNRIDEMKLFLQQFNNLAYGRQLQLGG